MCECPFLRAKKVRFGNSIFRTFLRIQTFRKSLCAFFLKCNFEISHFFCTFLHISSFRKRDCVIALFCCSLKKCKCAIILSCSSLKKCDCTFCCSLKMWDCAIALFVTLWKCGIVRSHFFVLFKCATKCAIAQSLFQKEQMCKNCKFWSHTFLHSRKSDDRTFSKCAIAQPWKG